MNDKNEMLLVSDIASELHYAPRSIRNWILDGRISSKKRIYLKAEKKKGKYYIKREDLEFFLKMIGENNHRNFC